MDGPDEIIHQSMRLKITATLNALPSGEQLEFNTLKAVLNATDGNMAPFHALLSAIQAPFTEAGRFMLPAPTGFGQYVTFCGT